MKALARQGVVSSREAVVSAPVIHTLLMGRYVQPGFEVGWGEGMGAVTANGDQQSRLTRPFKVIAFDWDGTAVVDRKEDATQVCRLLERLMRYGVKIVVITGTNLTNALNQLATAVRDAGDHNRQLYLATNRGSEVYGFQGWPQPIPLFRRSATPEESRQLDEVADMVRDALQAQGQLQVRVIYDRLNRRKVDLIPLPEWADPPKAEIGRLLEAVQGRLFAAGFFGGVQEALRIAERIALQRGMVDARVTSDVKHVEIGLTDKSDSMDWAMREVCAKNNIAAQEVLVAGDEFGPIGGVEGSDHKMVTKLAVGAMFVSVGPEPGGVEAQIMHLGGGPRRFRELLAAQIALQEGRRIEAPAPARVELPVERPTSDSTWLLSREGVDLTYERENESLFTVGNGYLGTRGALAEGSISLSSPATFVAGIFDSLPQSSAVPELAVAPDWTRLRILVEGQELRLDNTTSLEHRRLLDMRQGILWREWRCVDASGRITRLRGQRLASLAQRHLLLQALQVTAENYAGLVEIEVAVEPASGVVRGLPVARPRLLPVASEFGGIHRQLSRDWRNLLSGNESRFKELTPSEDLSAGNGALIYQTGSRRYLLALASSSHLQGDFKSVQPVLERRRDDGLLVEHWRFQAEPGQTYVMERLACVYTSRDHGGSAGGDPGSLAVKGLRQARQRQACEVAAAHVKAWSDHWQASEVQVQGDAAAQRALRFAIYHLLSAANPEDEHVSIGARSLSGESYKGHVFWDTDIFVLPLLVFTQPACARSLLMYRYHTLAGAYAKAASLGYRGALYAWESADTGEETTPRFVRAPDGETIPILTGQQEHHIAADVAYAVWLYWQVTGDEGFFVEAGAQIMLETARFWASRGQWGADQRFHIRQVIGPDEYHESVDDNAFTNGMAQWNLEKGVQTAGLLRDRWPDKLRRLRDEIKLDDREVEDWGEIAAKMYTGLDSRTGILEQFRGYFDLEEFDLKPLRAQGKWPAAMDMFLGRERIQRSKIIKQADVVMLLQLLWDRFPPPIREANFRYYEPRTCHGSSLSPGVHALVAARLGDHRLAQEYFNLAAQIDLANNMGNASGGVHAAALGSLWQAAVMGFGGVCWWNHELALEPSLPNNWQALRFSVRWRSGRVAIEVSQKAGLMLRLQGIKEMSIRLGSRRYRIEEGRDYRALPRADGFEVIDLVSDWN